MFMLIGYFSVFILFIVLGIIFRKAGWVFYGIGAALTLMSLLGGRMHPIYWLAYVVLLIAGAAIISARKNKEGAKEE